MRLEHRFVATRDQAGRVAGKIGELDHQARETGTRPARFVGPDRKLAEETLDDAFHRAGQSIAERLEGIECQPMLRLQDGGQKRILADKMIVECALGDTCGASDLVHAHATVATPTKLGIGRIENALSRLRRITWHRKPQLSILLSEFTTRRLGMK